MKFYLNIIESITDRYGNTYYSFELIDIENNKIVQGAISGGESTIRCGVALFLNESVDWELYSKSVTEACTILSYSKYTSLTENYLYAGCNPKDIASFIKSKLNEI